LSVLGIEHSKNKMVGGGALLDIARFHWVEWMQDDHSISNGEQDNALRHAGRRHLHRNLGGRDAAQRDQEVKHGPVHG
jgi:hypothetical protein